MMSVFARSPVKRPACRMRSSSRFIVVLMLRRLGSAARLLNDVIGPQQHRLRDREAQDLGGLQIDGELELLRPLHRQVAGLGVCPGTYPISCRPSRNAFVGGSFAEA